MAKKYIQEFKSKLSNGGTVSPEELQDFFSRLEGDLKDKKYGLVWESQTEQVIEQLKTNKVYLEEEQDLKITQDPDNPKSNILIEGDNYEALTYLKQANQKVDVIYIDPPYNTGNKDFIYNDRFIDKEDGYRHSKWLSFMDARLRLARELLTDDGVIFISIDDNEMAQLKLLCDHVFGEQNFVANMIRKTKSGGGNDSQFVSVEYEYLLVYAKRINDLKFTKKEIDVKNDKKYRLEDEHVCRRGKYYLRDLQYKGSSAKPSKWSITCPDGQQIKSDANGKDGHEWRWGEEKFRWGLANDFIVFKKVKGLWKVYIKQYQHVDNEDKIRIRTKPHSAYMEFNNSIGTKELKELLPSGGFSYPKPSTFVKEIVSMHPNPNAIVLDFFAGSGTTGHAVLELNKEDGGNRQFILVTNNENNIARDVTYERNKRVIEGYTTPKGKDVPGIPSNLAYYKTKQVSKYDINLDEVMLQHIIPTIQLTEGVYTRKHHRPHITQLGDSIFIFTQYKVDDDEIDTLVDLVKDGDTLYIQEGQVDYIKSKLPDGVVLKSDN